MEAYTPQEIVLTVLFLLAIASPAWAAIWVVRRREGTSFYNELAGQLRQMERERRRDHAEILRLQTVVAELNLGIKILIRQVERLNQRPDYTITESLLQEVHENIETEVVKPPVIPNLPSLQRMIARRFDINELDDLSFQLGIETGELGENTRSGKAQAIIKYMDRRGELDKLVEMLKAIRPNEVWTL
jgi:hypothetical protein